MILLTQLACPWSLTVTHRWRERKFFMERSFVGKPSDTSDMLVMSRQRRALTKTQTIFFTFRPEPLTECARRQYLRFVLRLTSIIHYFRRKIFRLLRNDSRRLFLLIATICHVFSHKIELDVYKISLNDKRKKFFSLMFDIKAKTLASPDKLVFA